MIIIKVLLGLFLIAYGFEHKVWVVTNVCLVALVYVVSSSLKSTVFLSFGQVNGFILSKEFKLPMFTVGPGCFATSDYHMADCSLLS